MSAETFTALLGVILGALITAMPAVLTERRRRAQDVAHLAVHLTHALERFASEAYAVAFDDGLEEGQRDDDGCLRPTTTEPSFDPSAFSVEWRSLDVDLMYDIFDFPRKIEEADRIISHTYDFDFPPNFTEFFEERYVRYADLGLEALALAKRVRIAGKLPKLKQSDTTLQEDLTARRWEIIQQRDKRNRNREHRAGGKLADI